MLTLPKRTQIETFKTENMENFAWYEDMNCAITVCDTEGVIIYQNKPARELYAAHGNLVGKNLFPCHGKAVFFEFFQILFITTQLFC